MRQKEIKSMGPTPSSPPRRNYEITPRDAFGIQGSRTDHRTLFNKWNALAVPLSGWTVRVGEGQSLILKTSILKTKESGGKGGKVLRSRRGPERRWFTLWRIVRRFRVRLSPTRELSDTKLYDSTQFFRFGSSIYDLSFMDVDKILPFSSTLGWHSLKVKGEVQTRKGLRWIPRHPETRKGVVSDEMLRGVENKRRSGDSRIGQPFELLLNPWAGKRQPGELKHLSSQRKRKQKRFP
ncbi:hypothetical protein O6P43_035772 [Quillaja saponaria]|uniref:Uncharacterized protein ycf68 n=2 Tax=Quillaja saponaria TaxID=32244 RepID=A0AAD7KJQ5_QUISA|nr:hypothetical protein O6P43_035772 [Quillaja saponaria]